MRINDLDHGPGDRCRTVVSLTPPVGTPTKAKSKSFVNEGGIHGHIADMLTSKKERPTKAVASPKIIRDRTLTLANYMNSDITKSNSVTK